MIKKIFLIPVFFTCFIASGQSISRQVVSSAGDTFTSASGSLSWTLGEVMTETFEFESSYLTQGFQQPSQANNGSRIGIVAYPNPTPDYVIIKTGKSGVYLVELFNVWGQRLISRTVELTSNDEKFTVDFQPLSHTVYILRILNVSTNENTSFKIEKI